MVFKCLKYTTRFVDKIKDLIEILLSIVEKLLPFLVLFFTIFIAYGFTLTFFFGDSFWEFTTVLGSIGYFLTNIHGNFDQAEDMYKNDAAFTLIFMAVFVFVINFLLVVCFRRRGHFF